MDLLGKKKIWYSWKKEFFFYYFESFIEIKLRYRLGEGGLRPPQAPFGGRVIAFNWHERSPEKIPFAATVTFSSR